MSQDLKCFLGIHRYVEPEVKEVKNHYGETTKLIYISRCSNCGKIHSKIVNYESYRQNT